MPEQITQRNFGEEIGRWDRGFPIITEGYQGEPAITKEQGALDTVDLGGFGLINLKTPLNLRRNHRSQTPADTYVLELRSNDSVTTLTSSEYTVLRLVYSQDQDPMGESGPGIDLVNINDDGSEQVVGRYMVVGDGPSGTPATDHWDSGEHQWYTSNGGVLGGAPVLRLSREGILGLLGNEPSDSERSSTFIVERDGGTGQIGLLMGAANQFFDQGDKVIQGQFGLVIAGNPLSLGYDRAGTHVELAPQLNNGAFGSCRVVVGRDTNAGDDPYAAFEVDGSFALRPETRSSAGSNLGLEDQTIFANISAGSFTITLPNPASSADGRIYKVQVSAHAAGNTCTVSTASGTINGASSVVLNKLWQGIEVHSDGTNWIAHGIGAGSIAGPKDIAGYLDGYRLVKATNATVTIGTAGKDSVCNDSTDAYSIEITGTDTADLTVSGAGGLDTGSEAADTIYHVYVIADSTGANSPDTLLSTSSTSPTMPTGYDIHRRLGAIINNSSSNIQGFVQSGRTRDRWIIYDVQPTSAGFRVLSGGSAGTFTNVDLSAYVPDTATRVQMTEWFRTGIGGGANDSLDLRPDGFGASVNSAAHRFRVGIISSNYAVDTVILDAPDQLIEYHVTDAVNNQAHLNVAGYMDEL